jgi:hypothetical protein
MGFQERWLSFLRSCKAPTTLQQHATYTVWQHISVKCFIWSAPHVSFSTCVMIHKVPAHQSLSSTTAFPRFVRSSRPSNRHPNVNSGSVRQPRSAQPASHQPQVSYSISGSRKGRSIELPNCPHPVLVGHTVAWVIRSYIFL